MLQRSGPSGHGPGKHSSGHSKARRKERIQILKKKRAKVLKIIMRKSESDFTFIKSGQGTQNHRKEIIQLLKKEMGTTLTNKSVDSVT